MNTNDDEIFAEAKPFTVINVGTEEVPIDSISLHPMNANEGDMDAIESSILELGLYKRIIVNKSSRLIVAGNHTYKAACKMGAETIPVEWIDVDEETELAILLRDNKTARSGRDNPQKVLDILAKIKASSPKKEALSGYKRRDINEIIEDIKKAAQPKSTGEMLSLVNICIEDPLHAVEKGDVFSLSGRHHLICASVITDHEQWVPYLKNKGKETLFCPHPGVFVPLTIKANNYDLVMVQPSPYISGHILDRYGEVFGESSIVRA
jgi:hypothetical protein